MANFKEKVQEMIDDLSKALTDADDLDKGKKVAATRLRNAMQDSKEKAQAIRKEVQTYRETL